MLLVLCIIVYLSALVKGGLDKVFYGIEFFAFLIVLFATDNWDLCRKAESFQ